MSSGLWYQWERGDQLAVFQDAAVKDIYPTTKQAYFFGRQHQSRRAVSTPLSHPALEGLQSHSLFA